MSKQKVVSREYKLMLKAKKFAGKESALLKKAGIFWQAMSKAVSKLEVTAEGNFDTIKTKRRIRFYDSKEETLINKKYIFRVRKEIEGDKHEATLKFRHPDRYVSQDRDMTAAHEGKPDIKFEEDIKAPFVVLYSFSSGCPVSDTNEFKKLQDIFTLYPGLEKELNGSTVDEKIAQVNKEDILEIVLTGASIPLTNDPSDAAECALIVWYGLDGFKSGPDLVEFSFRYKDKEENYPGELAQKAYEVFLLIQQEMKSWISNKDVTKTGAVFPK